MRIVDISALYSPSGGGIRTYTRLKLAAAERLGHDLTVVVPGAEDSVEQVSDAARLVSIASPRFPLDRNYFYFENDAIIHDALDRYQPDFIEASSPWGSATAVAEWTGTAPRALIMHADPLSAWAYRWFEGVFSRPTIDRGFDWFWRHLRRLDAGFDTVVCASPSLAARLTAGGLHHVETVPMGVESGVFGPQHRDVGLRARLLERCDQPENATLIVGVGRFSPEKCWPLIIAAATAAGVNDPLGLVLVGDGHGRTKILRAVGENPHIALVAPITDRGQMARMLASADLLIHGASAETFGLVAAEARASGLPIIVPAAGGAGDQFVEGQGVTFTAGDAGSAATAIGEAIARLPALTAASRLAARGVPTMDEHFEALFRRYAAIAGARRKAA
ncbi:glycosyltransferase [Polymorphobacter fuscus]|uniref:Glycosyltransferase n=1 Tax=Sandarakinorhabdus fusca TaxID=1439888 RepID=A0A7C9KI16_9SPHN|nr:glycosyltransferase [Polymorphobacter fuscus]KAB7647622.1 glycosyltransferase family 1 protein [Polymorphobacter fuscus]MQT16899.1 glycosyltransferase [Polymorphobacter fuscus]NJC09112.1 alpha-1,6-mannosyltransferase [Polymorphobacter fuscus]